MHASQQYLDTQKIDLMMMMVVVMCLTRNISMVEKLSQRHSMSLAFP